MRNVWLLKYYRVYNKALLSDFWITWRQFNSIKSGFIVIQLNLNQYEVPNVNNNKIIIKLNDTKHILKAAVRKFCLFVAIYVWKPGIAAVCGIIFRAWGCDPVFGTAPAWMNLMFWGVCVAVSHHTGVDIHCTSQSQILACLGIYDPNQNFHHILSPEQVSNKSATFVLINWGKKHYPKSRYQRWLNLTIG